MTILLCPAWPALPHIAARGFLSSRKGGGVGMEGDFSLAPRGGSGMGLHFLNPTRPVLPRHTPPRFDKG